MLTYLSREAARLLGFPRRGRRAAVYSPGVCTPPGSLRGVVPTVVVPLVDANWSSRPERIGLQRRRLTAEELMLVENEAWYQGLPWGLKGVRILFEREAGLFAQLEWKENAR